MSLMEQIKRAWDLAVQNIERPKHTYKELKDRNLSEEFMERLKLIPVGMDVIVTRLYSNYSGSKSELDRVVDNYDKLNDMSIGYQEERNKLKVERDELLESHSEWQRDYDTAMKEMRKYADKAEDLESALNTSRYFIYLSGMCGFVLGLACLYFVV